MRHDLLRDKFHPRPPSGTQEPAGRPPAVGTAIALMLLLAAGGLATTAVVVVSQSAPASAAAPAVPGGNVAPNSREEPVAREPRAAAPALPGPRPAGDPARDRAAGALPPGERPLPPGGGTPGPAGRPPVSPLPARPPVATTPPDGAAPPPSADGTVEVLFLDGERMRLHLLDKEFVLETRWGRLTVPADDVRRIDFARRTDTALAAKVDDLVRDLGHEQFDRREKAAVDLARIGEPALPALTAATSSRDPEVAARAATLVKSINALLPEDRRTPRAEDVIITADGRLPGRLAVTALKVRTKRFGEQTLQATDLASLSTGGTVAAAAPAFDIDPSVEILPDPGDLRQFADNVGKVFHFRVVGSAANGSLWGTDLYTTDSTLARAAVHTGLVRNGETAVVRVSIEGPQASFAGTARNGTTSSPYDNYPASYRITAAKVIPQPGAAPGGAARN